MPLNELAFEVTAQELMDPKIGIVEPIEFEDLDTVLRPATLPANESASALDTERMELELEADDIDALLGASGKLVR